MSSRNIKLMLRHDFSINLIVWLVLQQVPLLLVRFYWHKINIIYALHLLSISLHCCTALHHHHHDQKLRLETMNGGQWSVPGAHGQSSSWVTVTLSIITTAVHSPHTVLTLSQSTMIINYSTISTTSMMIIMSSR